MGILSAIAIPRLTGVRTNAATNADEASVRTMMSAVSIAEADGVLDLSTNPNAAAIETAIVPDFLNEIPTSKTGSGWNVSYDAGGRLVIEAIADGAANEGATFQDKP